MKSKACEVVNAIVTARSAGGPDNGTIVPGLPHKPYPTTRSAAHHGVSFFADKALFDVVPNHSHTIAGNFHATRYSRQFTREKQPLLGS